MYMKWGWVLGIMLGIVGLNGCTFLPGMDVHYYSQEVQEGPADIPYTLVRITPTLIDNMNGVEAALKKDSSRAIPFANSPQNAVYYLGPNDSLSIFVWGNPDLTPVLSVASGSTIASSPAGRIINDQGNIFFPLVGEMHAAGMTVSQFREELTKKLSKYIKDPQVEVSVAAFRSQKVFITGEVRSAGTIPITDVPLRMTDAIGIAGGLTLEADLYNVVVTRGKVSTQIDLNRLYYEGNTRDNILLQNGDIIAVPDRGVRKIYVMGEVGNSNGGGQARSYIMRRGKMSLTEVVSDAGGPNPFSSAANYIYVMRADENGDAIIYRLAARDPLALVMADQFTMRPRDVLFVAPTDITQLGRFVGQFFPLANSVTTVNSISTTPVIH